MSISSNNVKKTEATAPVQSKEEKKKFDRLTGARATPGVKVSRGGDHRVEDKTQYLLVSNKKKKLAKTVDDARSRADKQKTKEPLNA